MRVWLNGYGDEEQCFHSTAISICEQRSRYKRYVQTHVLRCTHVLTNTIIPTLAHVFVFTYLLTHTPITYTLTSTERSRLTSREPPPCGEQTLKKWVSRNKKREEMNLVAHINMRSFYPSLLRPHALPTALETHV